MFQVLRTLDYVPKYNMTYDYCLRQRPVIILILKILLEHFALSGAVSHLKQFVIFTIISMPFSTSLLSYPSQSISPVCLSSLCNKGPVFSWVSSCCFYAVTAIAPFRHYTIIVPYNITYCNYGEFPSCFSDRASWIDYTLITNLIQW